MADGEVLTSPDDYAIAAATLTIDASRAAPTQWVKAYDATASALGTLRTLKETVFAGITPTGYTTGNTYTIDGSDYVCSVAGNGAADMVATGLRLRRGTTSAALATYMNIAPGGAGNFNTIVGEDRVRRGVWALWIRMASYDFTNAASGNSYGGASVYNTLAAPKWGFELVSRGKNLFGTPNTATGGISFNSFMHGGTANTSGYPGVSTANVIVALVKGLTQVDVYYGTYSDAWPTLDSMTLMGRLSGTSAGAWLSAATSTAGATNASLYFHLYGAANASTGTYEIILDRWRLTSWD
jgi:hypothetical protein